jgi:hypothetical protein
MRKREPVLTSKENSTLKQETRGSSPFPIKKFPIPFLVRSYQLITENCHAVDRKYQLYLSKSINDFTLGFVDTGIIKAFHTLILGRKTHDRLHNNSQHFKPR